MSDLLLRLSERALGTLPTVKPLLRPGREAASLSGNDIASFESVTEQTTTPQRSSFTAAPPEMSESAPFDGEIQTAPTSRPAPQRPVQPSVRSLQEVMTRIYEDEPRDREPRWTRLPETDTMPLRIHAQRSRADETDVAQPQPSLPVAPKIEHVRAIDAPSRTDSQLRQEALPARREPAAPPRLQVEERRPDVQVNIGRIDLHTAPAPAVARRAPPSRPAALSLDSYLAARRGERA